MGRKTGPRLAAQLERLRERIEQWRQTRTKRTAMPDPLWVEVVAVARKHGLYASCRDLHVSYDSLKARLEGSARRPTPKPAPVPTFVEIGAPPPVAGTSASTSVELTRRDGASLCIRLAPGDVLDVAGLVRAFWGRRA